MRSNFQMELTHEDIKKAIAMYIKSKAGKDDQAKVESVVADDVNLYTEDPITNNKCLRATGIVASVTKRLTYT